MGNSEQVRITGLREREKEKIVTESNEQNIDQVEYARRRLRAGMLLWEESGGFDTERINKLIDGDLSTESSDTITAETSDIAAVIKKNLSQTEPTPLRSESEQDIIDIVVEEVVTDALAQLMDEDEVENIPGKGYQKS